VVPNGIRQPTVDRPAARRRLERLIDARGEHLIGTVGRVCPGKGQAELVEAAPAILARRDARLVLIGAEDAFHPGYVNELERRCEALGLSGAVHFVGHRDDAQLLIGGFDVVVVPSTRERTGWREGFGLVAAEAMWAGVPVVAYDTGSLSEVIGACGVVVPERDRAALAGAVVSLLGDEQRRAELGECGRLRVAGRFTLSANADGMRARYRALAAGR
jgi:glycosyltransferase involved in cell wall biosynthesis